MEPRREPWIFRVWIFKLNRGPRLGVGRRQEVRQRLVEGALELPGVDNKARKEEVAASRNINAGPTQGGRRRIWKSGQDTHTTMLRQSREALIIHVASEFLEDAGFRTWVLSRDPVGT